MSFIEPCAGAAVTLKVLRTGFSRSRWTKMEGLDDGGFRLCLRNDIAFFYRRLYFFAIEISVWVSFFRIVENLYIVICC